MPQVILKNQAYNVISQTIPWNAPEERYYQIVEREGKRFFFKHWVNNCVHKGLTEVLLHTRLNHPNICRLLNFELSENKLDLCLKFEYHPYDTLLNVQSLTQEDWLAINEQLHDVIKHLKENNVILTDYEDQGLTEYYQDIGHNVIFEKSKCLWDFGLSNIIWDTDQKKIYLIDFERHDQPWPLAFVQTMNWLKDLVHE